MLVILQKVHEGIRMVSKWMNLLQISANLGASWGLLFSLLHDPLDSYKSPGGEPQAARR